MRLLSGLLVLALMVSIVGCGTDGDNGFSETVKIDVVGTIKNDLGAIEKSGRVGSGMTNLTNNVTALKKTDPAKGELLEAGLKEIVTLRDPAKVKAKAKELLGAL